MKLYELIELLHKENVPEDYYSLNGGLPNEKWCLGKINSTWEIYYSERGLKSGLRRFDVEDEACDYFYTGLKKMIE